MTTITATIFLLFSLRSLLRMDVLVWFVAVPLLVGGVMLIVYQRRRQKELDSELAQLHKAMRHNIEYELVLKAMKLSTWRVDVPTRTVTFESDFRIDADNNSYRNDIKVDDVIKLLIEPYAGRVRQAMDDLMAGRIDEVHEQYQARSLRGSGSYWGEGFATVDKRGIDGRPLTLVGTNMRIDRQKEIEAELIKARNHAEESDRLKSAFLANISHEIRTPLNAIVGFSDVLPMAQSDEEREQLVTLIRQNNAHLLRLFDDLVNMSKLEAGGSEAVNKSAFELMPLFEEVTQRYADRSAQKGIAVSIQLANSGLVVNTDRDRLREILNQYVDNALKFTQAGTVTLGATEKDNTIQIWVRDTGKGIPKDRCDERLFERFVKVDEFVPGTGIGLSICRSQANKMGGSVGVESTEGKGSRFWVELPRV